MDVGLVKTNIAILDCTGVFGFFVSLCIMWVSKVNMSHCSTPYGAHVKNPIRTLVGGCGGALVNDHGGGGGSAHVVEQGGPCLGKWGCSIASRFQ